MDEVECYVDASLGTNDPNARSTSGYLILAFGDVVSWRCKKQTHVALSTSEAEFIAGSLACRECISVKELLRFLFKIVRVPIMYEDNQTAIVLAKSLEAKSLKHVVKLTYHYLRFEVLQGNIKIKWVPTQDQIADLLTKALPKPAFEKFRDCIVSDPPHNALLALF